MFFMLSQDAQDIYVNRYDLLPTTICRSEKLTFQFKSKSPVNGDGQREKLVLDTIIEKRVNKKLAEMFDRFELGFVPLDNPPQISLPYDGNGTGTATVDANGKITMSHGNVLGIFPQPFKDIHNQVSSELKQASDNLIRAIRWRQSCDGQHEPLAASGFTWSRDGEKWNSMPMVGGMTVRTHKLMHLHGNALTEIQQLLDRNLSEPLSHEMLREAAEIANRAPRSALLLAIAALETGVKSYISFIVPHSEIVLSSVQSPPIEKLINEVIPKLHKALNIQADFFPLEKYEADMVKIMISIRNRIVHGAEDAKRWIDIASFIGLIRRILYQFDALRGELWADERLHGVGQILVNGLPVNMTNWEST
jgi:hypothetical protein